MKALKLSASRPRYIPLIVPAANFFVSESKKKKEISVSDVAISSGFDFSRVAIPHGGFIGSVSIPASGSNADMRSSDRWLAKQAEARRRGGCFVPSKATTTPDVDAASVATATAAPRRRCRRCRSQERSSPSRNVSLATATKERVAAVNDATWQLVKKLVTLTVPLCTRRSLETPLSGRFCCFEPSLFPRRVNVTTGGARGTVTVVVVNHRPHSREWTLHLDARPRLPRRRPLVKCWRHRSNRLNALNYSSAISAISSFPVPFDPPISL